MESFGTSVYPSRPPDAQRTPTILQNIDAEVQRMEQANVFLNGAARAKHIRPVRRKVGAAGRARMAAVQKARWATTGK
jgi:hypothetical protein